MKIKLKQEFCPRNKKSIIFHFKTFDDAKKMFMLSEEREGRRNS